MSNSNKRLEAIIESRYLAWTIACLFLAVGVVLAFIANGTCGDGDSIRHYQFAKAAFKHHECFFDHWAKPFFVLLASPFAQFGFTGIKLFNVALSFFTALITFEIANHLKIKRRAIVVLFFVMSPALITHSLSGLTEPLFAFVLASSVLLYFKDKYLYSIVLLSFLPMVRSEGLIIIGVFALLLLLEKRFLLLPLLLTGHLVYAVAGYSTHKSLLWVFTEIPYAHISEVYGKGTWGHFFVNMPVITGIPLCILLVAGVLFPIFQLFTKDHLRDNYRELLLVYGCALAYFFAHVCFWALGIFKSFGLLRVLIGILPLMAIIELRGLGFLDIISNGVIRNAMVLVLLAWVLVFPVTPNPYAWHYKENFCLTTMQELTLEVSGFIKGNYSISEQNQLYYDDPFLAEALGVDIQDHHQSKGSWELSSQPPVKALLIWDEWYMNVENGITLETLINDNRFQPVKEFTKMDRRNYEHKIILFETKDF